MILETKLDKNAILEDAKGLLKKPFYQDVAKEDGITDAVKCAISDAVGNAMRNTLTIQEFIDLIMKEGWDKHIVDGIEVEVLETSVNFRKELVDTFKSE